ncbi:TPA: hypothetical protein ACH3X3_005076 [Trebouxia sp. C0006]
MIAVRCRLTSAMPLQSAQNSLPAPATSDRLYLNYNSVNESLDVTTNNKAWYPDLGSVVSTHHNRMANILTGESFTVLGRFQSALYASCSSVVFTMRVRAFMFVSRYRKSFLQSTQYNLNFNLEWLCTGCLAGFLTCVVS